MRQTEKDYSQYNERQLFNFLNSIDKQLIKAEMEQKRAVSKFQEIQLKKQAIRQAIAEKFTHKEPSESLLQTLATKDDPSTYTRHESFDALADEVEQETWQS